MMDDGQWQQRGDGEDGDAEGLGGDDTINVEMNTMPSSSGEERARAKKDASPHGAALALGGCALCVLVLVVVAFLIDAGLTLERKERDPDDCGVARAEEMAHLCATAEVQSPRNVSAGYRAGALSGRVPPVLNFSEMTLVNTHFQLGAEHFSAGEYDVAPASSGWGFHYGADVAPGYFCREPGPELGSPASAAFDWQHCEDVAVGNTYELHWVFSTAGGADARARAVALGPGLDGAFGRATNPAVGVQAVVYRVVNDGTAAHDVAGLLYPQMDYAAGAGDVVAYLGSTTGGGYDNDFCSPYQVSWHVDRRCRLVAAASLDAMCKAMKEDFGMEADARPHASRALVEDALSATKAYSPATGAVIEAQ